MSWDLSGCDDWNKKIRVNFRLIFNPFSDSFSVDGFLSRKTATIGLEKLRDDLGVYLKILRSAMIELINEDYAGKNSLARMKRAYSVIIT